MTDLLEALLDLPQEEEEICIGLRLPWEGRRPSTVAERVQANRSSGMAERALLPAGPVRREALTERAALVQAGTLPCGEARLRPEARTASEEVRLYRGAETTVPQAGQAGRWSGGYAALPDLAVEAVRDPLIRGTVFALGRHHGQGSGQHGGADTVPRSPISSREASAGWAAALERRLARSGVRPAAVRPIDDGQATVETGPDLEELDRRVRRDARRYDGALTLY